MKTVDLSAFASTRRVLAGTEWFFVVKSQDQTKRRCRMLASRQRGRFGRIDPRPTATGLLVRGVLEAGALRTQWKQAFWEPRHLCRLPNGEYLLSTVDKVLHIDGQGRVHHHYEHPFFGFLHTVSIDRTGRRGLVVSSGYDALIQIDLASGQELSRWFAWDHGFNPDEQGVWLAADPARARAYEQEGKRVLLVEPAQYGEQGILTDRRTAHPNAACYDPYHAGNDVIVSIAHSGNLYRVELASGNARLVTNALAQMPHGIRPFQGGWLATDTTRGEWVRFDACFAPLERASVCQMPGKPADAGDAEWLQEVVPVGKDVFLAVDANRGLLAVDCAAGTCTQYAVDAEWCIQGAHCFNA